MSISKMTDKQLASLEMPEFDVDDEMQLEVGVLYQGSFRIGKDGKIIVKPYKQGTKPSNLKKMCDGDRHVIYLSKNLVRIVISIQRGDEEKIRKAYQETVIECYRDLCDINL